MGFFVDEPVELMLSIPI